MVVKVSTVKLTGGQTMNNRTFAYMRISTKEERGKQRFSRQENAIRRYCKEHNVEITDRRIYKDDSSGKSFHRKEWQELEKDISSGDTIIFKDICRFTREYENGFKKYMELMDKGINLVFIDNCTISTDYIKSMLEVAEKQENRIAKKTLKDTIELLLLVELDRAEKEREIMIKRIKDGIQASTKKSGRPFGKLDKMTDELKEDLKEFISQKITDKRITISDLIKKHNISRNTVKKYIRIIESNMNKE